MIYNPSSFWQIVSLFGLKLCHFCTVICDKRLMNGGKCKQEETNPWTVERKEEKTHFKSSEEREGRGQEAGGDDQPIGVTVTVEDGLMFIQPGLREFSQGTGRRVTSAMRISGMSTFSRV